MKGLIILRRGINPGGKSSNCYPHTQPTLQHCIPYYGSNPKTVTPFYRIPTLRRLNLQYKCHVLILIGDHAALPRLSPPTFMSSMHRSSLPIVSPRRRLSCFRSLILCSYHSCFCACSVSLRISCSCPPIRSLSASQSNYTPIINHVSC